jgi:hypothetical protein
MATAMSSTCFTLQQTLNVSKHNRAMRSVVYYVLLAIVQMQESGIIKFRKGEVRTLGQCRSKRSAQSC